MSKLIKVAAVLAVAVVAIAAKQMTSVDISAESQLVAPANSVAPMPMMTNVGPLPETKVASYF